LLPHRLCGLSQGNPARQRTCHRYNWFDLRCLQNEDARSSQRKLALIFRGYVTSVRLPAVLPYFWISTGSASVLSTVTDIGSSKCTSTCHGWRSLGFLGSKFSTLATGILRRMSVRTNRMPMSSNVLTTRSTALTQSTISGICCFEQRRIVQHHLRFALVKHYLPSDRDGAPIQLFRVRKLVG